MGGCDTTNRLSTDTYPLRGVGDSTQPKRDKQAGKQAVVHSINSFSNRQFVKQSYRTLRTSTSGILINKKREGKGRKEPKKKKNNNNNNGGRKRGYTSYHTRMG